MQIARITGSYPDDLNRLIEGAVEAGVFGGKSDALREHGVELRLGLTDEGDAAYEAEAATELKNGVGDHLYLQSALDTLDDEIPVATISETVANREAVVSSHLDPGEAQVFALVDAHDGRLLTDDADARSFGKNRA